MPGPSKTETTLTPPSLRNALIEIGATSTEENLALAEAFAKLGVPLTEENLSEGRSVLAREPGLSPVAYALAKTLELPRTPAVLKALAAVVQGWQTGKALPDEVMRLLSLAPDAALDSTELASQIARVFNRLGQSTESRLTRGNTSQEILLKDVRASLMRLAEASDDAHLRAAADSHAALIEGQQLLNQVSLAKFDPPVALYFAFPLQFGTQTLAAEVQVWNRDDREPPESEKETTTYLRATVRVAPPRLGRVEVRLLGTWAGVLSCVLCAEKPSSYRLMRREAENLIDGLGKLGWKVTAPTVTLQKEFPPLWYGGDALSHPRTRIDHHV